MIYNFAGQEQVIQVMSHNRFLMLNKYLHLSYNNTDVSPGGKGYNPFYKVLPLLDIMKVSCHKSYDLDRDLYIDEAMVCFKGHKHIKVSHSTTVAQRGLQVWTLVESKSGYIADFEVFDGKQGADRYAQGVGFAIVDASFPSSGTDSFSLVFLLSCSLILTAISLYQPSVNVL